MKEEKQITTRMLKDTTTYPDIILNSENIGLIIFIKDFNNIGKLMVLAEHKKNNSYYIKDWDWITSIMKKSIKIKV